MGILFIQVEGVAGCDRRPRSSGRGQAWAVSAAVLVLAAVFAIAGSASGQVVVGTNVPGAEAALGDPVVATDAQLHARRAQSWSAGGRGYLLLSGDVRIAVGNYGFSADVAVVRIDVSEQIGRRVRHLAIYFQNAARGGGGTWAEADRLLVTVSTLARVELTCDLLDPLAEQPSLAFVAEATTRFHRYYGRLKEASVPLVPGPPLVDPKALAAREQRREQIRRRTSDRLTRALPDEDLLLVPRPAVVAITAPGTTAASDPVPAGPVSDGIEGIVDDAILPAGGTVIFTFRNVVRPGPAEYDEDMLFLMGKVAVVYQDAAGRRTMSLRAERAVIFLAPDALPDVGGSSGKVTTDVVRGIYLEDNVVATDGDYTVRGPRIYYDPVHNKAVILQAVFYAWDPRRQVPIYMRADMLRQQSRQSWRADRALLTTSEFGEPHFAIGANKVTIRQAIGRDGETAPRFTARGTTARLGSTPVFYWPVLSGEANDVALKRLSGGYDGRRGVQLRTRWDVFSLLGGSRPDGVNLSANIDVRGQHGFALGASLDYDRRNLRGTFDGYVLPLDSGDDEIADRLPILHDDDARGFAAWRHRQNLQDDWDLSLELAAVSDETLLEEFFAEEAQVAKPYETSVYAKKQQKEWAFTALVQHDLNDFTPQTTPLQSPGHLVEKLPEVGYYLFGRSLWGDRLTYSSENRLSRMRINLGGDSPSDRGFTAAQSFLNFGIIDPATSFHEANPTMPTDYRLRLDTRHEVQAPMTLGPLDMVPYVAGRVTAYDSDFDAFSADSESVRLWGIGGVRLHGEAGRTYEQVDIQWLDVHRMRHVIEPGIDLSYADATVSSDDYPVYDTNVEDIREGGTVRVGVRNTLQTQRGGPGRWRTVDWVVVNTDFVFTGEDTDSGTPVARYIAYRPEYSTGGDHFYSDVMWMISDTLAAVAEINYNMDSDDLAEWRFGATLQHTPRLNLFVDFAEIDVLRSRLMTYGLNYDLSRKYSVGLIHRLDFQAGGTRTISVRLERRLPRWRFAVIVAHDAISDRQSFSVTLIPEGLSTFVRPLGMADALSP